MWRRAVLIGLPALASARAWAAAQFSTVASFSVLADMVRQIDGDLVSVISLVAANGAALSGPLYSDALSPPDGPAAGCLAMPRHNTALFVRAMRPAS